MIKRKLVKIFAVLTGGIVVLCFAAAALAVFAYLKVLPAAISNPRVINYIEKTIKTQTKFDLELEKPVLKTSLAPEIEFALGKAKLKAGKNTALNIENFDTKIDFSQIFHKKIILDRANARLIFVDVNKLLAIMPKSEKQTKSDWSFDVFHSVMNVSEAEILYKIDKKTNFKLDAKNIKIDDNFSKKYVKYDIFANLTKDKRSVNIETSDNGKVYIENMEKLVVEDGKIFVNNSKINYNGILDTKSNYDFNFSSKNFSIPEVITFLDSQIIENNLASQLVYFKDIDGNFDFNANITNKNLNGKVNLNKLSFKLIPLANLPVLLNGGKVTFNSKDVKLNGFKGYYNNKLSNKMTFDGTVKDYMKSVDTDLQGDAVVTDDFAKNYMAKLIGYPIGIKGKADTRVMLKSKYGKLDLIWLYKFDRGTGFIVDGEESTMNNLANRVLAAKMHFENMVLDIKSINYYAGNPEDKMADKRIPILSMYGNIDFSNGETFVRRFGMELPKPMPAGFINMLIKQKIFKGGTFTGHIDVLNRKGGNYPPKIKADMKLEKAGIPSQRLFIKNGHFKTDKDLMYVTANGRFRRSAYDLSGAIVNELKFPIVVKNITLSIDDIDVEKYLQAFNAQTPSDSASTDVKAELEKSAARGGDVDDDDNTQTFDLANLIIEECILKAQKGFYKDIKFSNAQANLTLDKNSLLTIASNRFDIAEGTSSAKIECDLKKHKYSIKLGIRDVNSEIIASSLLNLSKEISGKASGVIELDTDDTLKLNGKIKFKVNNGTIGKVGLVEYLMKVASLFRNPLAMVSPSVISDLVNIPEGRFDEIDGNLQLKDNVVKPMIIKSTAPQLSSFIIGTYNLENQDAALRVYTKFSNRRKGLYGFFRNISLNALANRIPLSNRNDSNYYEAEISQLPAIDADEKDCQIFLTKVDGDIEHNNFISSLKKIK